MMHHLTALIAPFLTADYLWMALVVIVGACLQGVGGIGFGMFVGPVLAILHQELVPGPVLFLSALISIMSALREYRAIDFPALGYALVGRVPASILASMTIAILPMRAMSIVFALLILIAIAMSLRGWRVTPGPRNYMFAGAASGFMGTITSVGAPPMVIVYQDFSGPQVRATLGVFFAVGCVISLIALALFGRFGLAELNYGISLTVPMMVGFAASNMVVARIKREHMRLLILAFSGCAAIVLLALQVA
ncbi:MAG: TSUP family transporter [Noviherbaspirillum sp.]